MQFEIDWAPIVGAVVWMPAEHRRATVDESTAMRMLRCTPESFAALKALGLVAEGEPGHELYDANDIRNAALYSRSGRTEVETAMRGILSFMRGSDKDLFGERGWRYQLAPTGPPGPERCLLHPPTPEAFGGWTGELLVDDAPPTHVGDRVSVPFGASLRGPIVTRGRPATVLDSKIRAIVDAFVASGVRWHYLTEGLKADPHAACANGVGNCDTMSAVLAEQLVDAGYEARVFRGWIVGVTEVPHSWVEVIDGDGQVKVADPSLLVLARHSVLGSPDFAAKALGSAVCRVVPTRCDLSEPVGVTPDGLACDVTFSCRPAAAASVSGTTVGSGETAR
jgi:hypothetical protein